MVAHAGSVGLRLLADRVGLTTELSKAMARRSFVPVHDRGRVLVDVAVIETHSGEFVGDCGLTVQEVEGAWMVEAGWHVRSPLRRQGYAAEAASAVRVAAREAGIEHPIAIIRPDNVASQAVAKKIGLALEHEIYKNGGPALVFGAALHASQADH